MEKFFEDFNITLLSFMNEIHGFYQNDKIKKFIETFNKLDIMKILKRYNTLMKEYEVQLSDDKLDLVIDHKFFVFPSIDLYEILEHVTLEQRKQIKQTLHKLYILSSLVLSIQMGSTSATASTTPSTTETFNPFIGIKGAQGSDFSVNNVIDDKIKLPESKNEGASGGGLLNIMGGNLNDQLKNLDPKTIDDASGQIKQMLGDNVDPAVSNMIGNILHTIGTELKSTDLSQGNAFSNITRIAENVAQKMMPAMEKDKQNVEKLFMSTQTIAKGWGMDGNDINPMALMGQLMSGQMPMPIIPPNPNITLTTTQTTPTTVQEIDEIPEPQPTIIKTIRDIPETEEIQQSPKPNVNIKVSEKKQKNIPKKIPNTNMKKKQNKKSQNKQK